MIAEMTATRIIEVNREGQIVKEIELKVSNPDPHTDTRLVRQLNNVRKITVGTRGGRGNESLAFGLVAASTTTLIFRIMPNNGDYLACQEGDGCVRKYDAESGSVVWEYEVPMFGLEAAQGHGPAAFRNKAFAAV